MDGCPAIADAEAARLAEMMAAVAAAASAEHVSLEVSSDPKQGGSGAPTIGRCDRLIRAAMSWGRKYILACKVCKA